MQDPIEIVCGWAVPANDSHHKKWIQERGSIDHDWQLLEWLWPYIPKGSTVVDIGSHIGTHAVPYMRAVGAEGAVIALEPSPINFCCLLFNMMKEASQWKKPPAWHAEMIAAENYSGLVGMIRESHNYGATFCVPISERTHLREFPEISRCASVRHLLLELNEEENVSFVKVDVEGYEPRVLKSLYLLRRPFTLFVEVNRSALERAGSSTDELYSAIAENVDPKGHSMTVYQNGESLDEVPFSEPDSFRDLEMYDLLVVPKTT